MFLSSKSYEREAKVKMLSKAAADVHQGLINSNDFGSSSFLIKRILQNNAMNKTLPAIEAENEMTFVLISE